MNITFLFITQKHKTVSVNDTDLEGMQFWTLGGI